jgi:hypothetical protein
MGLIRDILGSTSTLQNITLAQCHEIFYLCCFHQTTLSRPLIHGLKLFRIWLRIHEDIRQSRLVEQRCQLRRCIREPSIQEARAALRGKINLKKKNILRHL